MPERRSGSGRIQLYRRRCPVPALSPNVSPEAAKVGQITISRLARQADWTERVTLLRAIQDWNRHAVEYRDQLLWRRLVAIDPPAGRLELPPGPLYPRELGEDGKEKHERRAWIEAVALLKQNTKSDGGYGLYVLDIVSPSAAPEIASDAWIETIQPEEVCFATSQITRNQKVFAVSVGTRPSPAKVPAERVRGTADLGGHPVTYPWHEFWTELVRIAERSPDGLPKRRSLTSRMLAWIPENWEQPPAESTVRNKFAMLYRALEGRLGEGPHKFGGDQFWIELVLIAVRSPDGLPDEPDLIEHMLEWVSKDWINQPAENTMRAEISRLYRALRRP